jgi:hypothetical protein
MKALVVQPPWSSAIAAGVKVIENRSWGTSYRGPLLIVAGARWSKRGAADRRIRAWWWGANFSRPTLEATDLSYAFRRAACVCELVDVHPDGGCCRPWGESEYTDDDGKTRASLFHWVLEETRPVQDRIPVRGRLGLWTPDPDLVAAVTEATAV